MFRNLRNVNDAQSTKAVNILVNRLEHTGDRQVILELDSDRLVRQRLED